MDPQTPLSRILATPSDLPCLSPPVELEMTEPPLPWDATPGLALREREERKGHQRHIKNHRPHVLEASARLQNAFGIRNQTIWPTPPLPDAKSSQPIIEANRQKLREALSECQCLAVRMDRSSHFRDFLDKTVNDLPDRQTWINKRAERSTHHHEQRLPANKGVESLLSLASRGRTPVWNNIEYFKETNESYSVAGHAEPTDEEEVVDFGPEYDLENWQTGGPLNESPFGGVLLPSPRVQSTKSSQHSDNREDLTDTILAHKSIEEVEHNEAPKGEGFLDPLDMPSSFTAAIWAYPEFTVTPLLSMTLKNVAPQIHSPQFSTCILLRQFEIGLDDVEGIVAGEVKIPETPDLTRRREDRLGKLGLDKVVTGTHSESLEQEQRRIGWGQGRWVFFGVKFRQGQKPGKWLCFGAPVEAVEKASPTLQYVEIGGTWGVSTHEERFIREKIVFCLGGRACMDSWDGADEWDERVLSDIDNAMANMGLGVETLQSDAHRELLPLNQYLHGDKAESRAKMDKPDSPRVPAAAVDESAEPPKRKRSVEAEVSRKACGTTRSKDIASSSS